MTLIESIQAEEKRSAGLGYTCKVKWIQEIFTLARKTHEVGGRLLTDDGMRQTIDYMHREIRARYLAKTGQTLTGMYNPQEFHERFSPEELDKVLDMIDKNLMYAELLQ